MTQRSKWIRKDVEGDDFSLFFSHKAKCELYFCMQTSAKQKQSSNEILLAGVWWYEFAASIWHFNQFSEFHDHKLKRAEYFWYCFKFSESDKVWHN